jgi:hypothetical protein
MNGSLLREALPLFTESSRSFSVGSEGGSNHLSFIIFHLGTSGEDRTSDMREIFVVINSSLLRP